MHQAIIIGAGPAGIAAAIQLKRCNIDVLVLEKDKIGGLLKNANLVENYPGFPQGISGKEFVALLENHLKTHDVGVAFQKALKIGYDDKFIIETTEDIYFSKFLIVATGTKPKKLEEFWVKNINHKVFYEVNQLDNLKGKEITILGSGDAAFDYALSLCKSNKITILNRSKNIKALDLLYDKCVSHKNITYFDNTVVKNAQILEDKLLLDCKNTENSNVLQLQTDYLLAAIGRKPEDSLIKHLDTVSLKNKLFIVGDVKNGNHRQAAIAVGDGLKAAMQIVEVLKNG